MIFKRKITWRIWVIDVTYITNMNQSCGLHYGGKWNSFRNTLFVLKLMSIQFTMFFNVQVRHESHLLLRIIPYITALGPCGRSTREVWKQQPLLTKFWLKAPDVDTTLQKTFFSWKGLSNGKDIVMYDKSYS